MSTHRKEEDLQDRPPLAFTGELQEARHRHLLRESKNNPYPPFPCHKDHPTSKIPLSTKTPSRRSSRSSTRSRRKSKQRERGRKPDAFTNKSQYRLFRQQLYLYIEQNPDIYRNDIEKVQFTLGFFTEGLPAEWAFLFIEKVAKKNEEKIPTPWGTWSEFYQNLR